MEVSKQKRAHIVLVHGACHGSWCWYKLKPLLEAAGYHVTAPDMLASGINPKRLDEVRTFADYISPLLELMDSIPRDEKVVLVGHSLGGLSISLAMEKYPEKISVAVYVCALMPDTKHRPSYVLDQFLERTSAEEWLDSQLLPIGNPEDSRTSMSFGTKYTKVKLYSLGSPQDVALANASLRPGCLFREDLSQKNPLSNERYGSVKRVYVVCNQDIGITANFQRWQIENFGVDEVKEIETADHVPMISRPQELFQHLVEIANEYA